MYLMVDFERSGTLLPNMLFTFSVCELHESESQVYIWNAIL